MSRKTITLTQGAIDNHYLPLRSILDYFPVDAIGGTNESSGASRRVHLDFGAGLFADSDICASKKIFRARGAVREFLARIRAKEGDRICVEQVSAYRYVIRLL